MNPKMHSLAWEKPRGGYEILVRKLELLQIAHYRGALRSIPNLLYTSFDNHGMIEEILAWNDGGGAWFFGTEDGDTKLLCKYPHGKHIRS